MAASPFDNLVAQLSSEERNALLERIRSACPFSSDPLFPASSSPGATAPQSPKLEDLGLLIRFVLFLRGLFSGKSREEIVREDELKEIGHKIELKHFGLISRRRELLLGAVAEELRALRDSARFFYDALDRSVERDKSAFYTFLGSIELPQVHERLLEESDPAAIALAMLEARGAVDEAAVRSAALAAFDSVFSDLPDRGRRSMYQDLRSVLFLKRLSGFLFDRLLGMFKEIGEQGPAASYIEVRELLLELGDVLFSMSEAPSIELMEAIFVFAERDELARSGEDTAAAVGEDMTKAERMLERIRSFNARIPLGDLLRLVSSDPYYLPKDLPGGEDWLAIYKAYWRERIESSIEQWKAEHRTKELLAEIAAFVGEPGPMPFAHISRQETEESPGLRYELALAFLDAFYRGPFLRELNRLFKIVLVDGEFYRKDNRVEFTDAYDSLLRIPELVSALDARLGPEGEIGGAWVAACREIGGNLTRRRKAQNVSRLAEEEAEQIIKREGMAFKTMVLIILGFLKGEAGGRYDSLANLSTIDGKASKEFQRNLDKAKDRCEKGLALLAEVSGLDLERAS
jgi:hypothetical protein